MMKKAVIIVIAILLIALAFCLGFIIAKNIFTTDCNFENISFYAYLQVNNDGFLQVAGIPENDVNHRGEFYVSLKNPNDEKAVKNSSGEYIDLGDIPVGSLLRITYDGLVMETYPAQINSVYFIEIIE